MGHGEEQQGRSRAASPLRLDGCVPATAPPPGPIEQAPVVEKRGKGATRVEEEQGRSRAAAHPPGPVEEARAGRRSSASARSRRLWTVPSRWAAERSKGTHAFFKATA